MSDIKRCDNCRCRFHIDNGVECVVCGNEYCGACDYDNGNSIYSNDGEEINGYFICKDCMKLPLEKINEDNIDNAIFTQEDLNKTIKEFNEKTKKYF